MGVYLKWKQATGASYNQTQIYRGNLQAGPYTLIATQPYDNVNYYDIDGTTGNWYEIRFYDTVLAKYSDFSEPIQGGTFRGYCTVEDLRDMSNLTSSDITDANLARFISLAGQQLNNDTSVYIEDERVTFVDKFKSNTIDGSNLTFYTNAWPIGDYDNNFTVNLLDLFVDLVDNSTNPATRTPQTLTSITPETGQFVLSSAPGPAYELLVTYRYCQIPVTHPLMRQACMFLTAAWAYQKINIGKAPQFKIGNVSMKRDMDSFKYYYNKYKDMLLEINNRSMVDIKQAPSMYGINGYERNPTAPIRSATTEPYREGDRPVWWMG
jgi:hypothetical protein